MPNLQAETDIIALVDAFYVRVHADELLRPVFSEVVQVDWPAHLPKMYGF